MDELMFVTLCKPDEPVMEARASLPNSRDLGAGSASRGTGFSSRVCGDCEASDFALLCEAPCAAT
jgi:hypothetical protein